MVVVKIHWLKKSGNLFGWKTFCLSISRMSNDAPATSYVLNIKGHNAFYGCQVCTTKGSWITTTNTRAGGRGKFPGINSPPKNVSSFREWANPQHHNIDGIRSVAEEILVHTTPTNKCIPLFQCILMVLRVLEKGLDFFLFFLSTSMHNLHLLYTWSFRRINPHGATVSFSL